MPALSIALAAATLFASSAHSRNAVSAPPATFAVAARIAGPDGGWDYAQVDPVARRLYVARSDSVTAIDLRPPHAVRSIGTIAHGHAVVPLDAHALLVTSARDDSVRLFDTTTGRQTGRIAVGADPDAALYDAAHHEAVVMNAKAGTVSIIDVATATVRRTITLKPGLEFAALDAERRLFVNNEDANEIETADLTTGAAGTPIALPGCAGPTGLAHDQRTRHLYSACDNGRLAVVDASTRRLVALVPIGRGPDAVILDAQRRLVFVPCGTDGRLDVFAIRTDGTLRPLASLATEVGARTGALDPVDGAVYLPTAHLSPPTPTAKRGVPLKGSFHVLVVRRT